MPKKPFDFFADELLKKLPPMSQREEEFLRQRWRQQIKPKSVALLEQAMKFYTTVGQAISHWSRMEVRLVQVVAKLLGISQSKAGLVMYSIINFNVWLSLIDDLFVIDGSYPNSLKKWRNISEALRAIKDIRDALAHHAMVQETEITNGQKGIQAYLRPSKKDTRAKSKKAKPLPMLEILAFTGEIGKIHEKLIVLLELMKQPKSSR